LERKFGQGDNEEEWREYGRLDSISQVYAQRRTPVSRTFSVSEYESMSRRDMSLMTPVPIDNANVDPIFWVKELNSIDPRLDLVQSQMFKEKEIRVIQINGRWQSSFII